MSDPNIVTVAVTQAHIDAATSCGSPYLSRTCPIARALNDHLLPGMVAGVIGLEAILSLEDEDQWIASIDLPPEVGEFVLAFDGGYQVQPFTFTVTL